MSDLKEITKLATLQITLEDEVASLEDQLKDKKAELRKVSEDDLPEALEAAGVTEFTLKNGRKVELAKSYHAAITEANKYAAFAWLRQRGFDGIIKHAVTFTFDRGQDNLATEVVRRVLKGYPQLKDAVEDKETVHPQTLKAFVKEQMEEGSDIPTEPFGIFVRRVAKIGVAKKKAK